MRATVRLRSDAIRETSAYEPGVRTVCAFAAGHSKLLIRGAAAEAAIDAAGFALLFRPLISVG